MTILVTRDPAQKMMHTVIGAPARRSRSTSPPANGGEDRGPTPHDLYDSALGACKAMTVFWYAQRKQPPARGRPSGRRPRRQRTSAGRLSAARRADRSAARSAPRSASELLEPCRNVRCTS